MSNFTTAGNLAVSQNTTIGGNLTVAGNLIPTGNINLAGNLNVSSLNVNSSTTFNNTVNLAGGSGGLYLNSNPIYTGNDQYNYIATSSMGFQAGGYFGGTLGYTSTNGPFPANQTPVIYWSNSNIVGINTTSPAYSLDVNGSFNVNSNVSLCTQGLSANVTIGNNISSTGALIVQSNIPATAGATGALIVTGGATVSGNVIVSSSGILMANSSVASTTTTTGAITTKGGIGVLGNINVGGNVSGNYGYFNRIVPNGPYDLKLYTGTTDTIYINGDSSGDLRFNTSNFSGKTYFDNGNVTIGNSTSSLGQLQLISGLTSTTTGTGAVVVTGGVGISGNLNVGGTINGVLTTTGNITANAYGFNYSTVPTLLNTQIGYKILNTSASSAVAANTYVYSTVSLPIGTYIISIMVNIINSATAGTFRFGLMTSSGGTYNISYNMTNSVGASANYGNTLTAVITISTAGVQYYGYTNSMTITTQTSFNISLVRIA